MWAQPIGPLACYFTPEDIRARRAEDEGRTEMGVGGEQDSGDEETGGPGKTGDSSSSLDPQLSQIHIQPPPLWLSTVTTSTPSSLQAT